MTQIAQGAHAYIFQEPGQVYRVQADDVATVQVIYGAPSALITLTAQSQTFGPYDSPAKLKVSANTAACEYTLIRAHYAELTQQQLSGGAVGVLASNNAGGAIEPDGDVPSLGGPGSSVAVVNDLTTGGTTSALSAEMGKTLQASKLGASADAIADVLEDAATGAPADLARIQSSVSGGGKSVPPFDGIQYDVKMLGAGRVLTLPNPYPGQVHAPIHPSIVESRTGFGGYRYWLAYTPYPGYAALYENPCVAASNNLVDWFEPATNPLVAAPAGSPATGYNADTHIAFNANESELHLIFRERLFASGNSVQHMSTTDGKTWSSRVALFGGAIGTQDVASPSLWWTGAKWRIISHNLDNALRPLELWESSSSDIRSVYTKLTTVGIAAAPGRLWWHTHVVAQSDGSLIGLAQDNVTSGTSGELYVIHSGDGGFSFAKRRLAGATSGKYRSALLPQVGGALAIVSDYGTLSLSVKNLQATPYNSSALPVTASAVFDDVALADNFNRADSTTIGTSSSGVGYSTSTWGILSNKAYAVTNGVCVINSGKADHSVFAKLHSVETNSGQVWLVVRRPSANDANFWRMGMSGNTMTSGITLVLQCIVAGAVAATYVCGAVSPGDRFGVIAIGHALICVVNGAVSGVVIDARNSTGMFCGLQGNASTNMLIDDLVIRTV